MFKICIFVLKYTILKITIILRVLSKYSHLKRDIISKFTYEYCSKLYFHRILKLFCANSFSRSEHAEKYATTERQIETSADFYKTRAPCDRSRATKPKQEAQPTGAEPSGTEPDVLLHSWISTIGRIEFQCGSTVVCVPPPWALVCSFMRTPLHDGTQKNASSPGN